MSTTTRLSVFTVYCSANTDGVGLASNALYANGRHQLMVEVSIIKQVNGTNTPLTATEISSINILEYGQSGLPAGWNSSKTCAGYSHGLLSGVQSRVKGEPALSPVAEPAAHDSSVIFPEQFYFYLSTGDANLVPKRLVATIKLDGIDNIITTGDTAFNKILSVSPTRPYVINSNDLITYDDQLIYHDEMGKNEEYNVFVQYWSMPYGLTFKSYKISGSLYQGGSYAIWFSPGGKGPLRSLGALQHGRTSFDSGDFLGGSGVNGSPVTIPDSDSLIRAFQSQKDGWYWVNDQHVANCILTICDNYGCEYAYVFYPTGSYGDRVGIRNL